MSPQTSCPSGKLHFALCTLHFALCTLYFSLREHNYACIYYLHKIDPFFDTPVITQIHNNFSRKVLGKIEGNLMSPCFVTCRYKWLFHVNPNYYGFSAMIRLLLQGRGSGSCDLPSALECYPSSAEYVLTYFDLQAVNPFFHICVSVIRTIITHNVLFL